MNAVQQQITDAQQIADLAFKKGIKENDVPNLLKNAIESKRRHGQNLDPYAVLLLLDAFNSRFYPNDESLGRLNAFLLMARATLNAPFMTAIGNDQKKNLGSYNYFRFVANYKTTGLFVNQNGEIADLWQIYFHGDAYFIKPLLWLHALYHFYTQEARWLLKLKEPFADPHFMMALKQRISYRGLRYERHILEQKYSEFCEQYIDPRAQLSQFITKKRDELHIVEADYLMNEYSEDQHAQLVNVFNDETRTLEKQSKFFAFGGHKEVEFARWLSEHHNMYEITDVNIYWHLLKDLAHHGEHLQEPFWNIMMSAGADPMTLIDNKGTTPLDLAQAHQLRIIVKKVIEYLDGPQSLLGSLANRMLYPAKRIEVSDGSARYQFVIPSSGTAKSQSNVFESASNKQNNLSVPFKRGLLRCEEELQDPSQK